MELCSDGHGEVCFDARKCPACEALKEKDNKISELESERDNLAEELANQ